MHDPVLGFLGSCPSNCGTGLRASVHVRLPLLAATGELRLLCDQLRLQPRGVHGEHSKVRGRRWSRGVFTCSRAACRCLEGVLRPPPHVPHGIWSGACAHTVTCMVCVCGRASMSCSHFLHLPCVLRLHSLRFCVCAASKYVCVVCVAGVRLMCTRCAGCEQDEGGVFDISNRERLGE